MTADQKALATGYKDVINSTNVHNIDVVKQSESLSDLSQNTFQMKTGKEMNDIGGGGGSTVLPDGQSHLEVIVMDATTQVPFVDRASGATVNHPSSAGEISAHEIIGHQLADEKNSVNASGLNSVQVTNLYLRTQGINTYYRTEHIGLPFSTSKVEWIPDYLK